MVIQAKFKGRCKTCNERIEVGEPINYLGKGGGAHHVRCKPVSTEQSQQPNTQEETDMETRQVVVTVQIGSEKWIARCGCEPHDSKGSALACSRRVKDRVGKCYSDRPEAQIELQQMDYNTCAHLPTVKDTFGCDVAQESAPARKQSTDSADAKIRALRELFGAGELDENRVREIACEVAQTMGDMVADSLRRDMVVTKRFEIPALDKTIEPAPGEIQHPSYETLAKLIAGGVTRIWITGDAGTGKTHAVEQVCKALGWPLYTITPVVDKYELFGYSDANGNYVPTQLYAWAMDPHPNAVLLFDELDGCMPNALVAANAALANGMAVFPKHGNVAIASTKLVIATANTTGEGPTIKYSARLAQDGALIDRFEQIVHWGCHEPTERAIALAKSPCATTPKAVDASVKIRRNLDRHGIELAWGPRRTYSLCKAMAAGLSLKDAALGAGLCKLDEHGRNRALEEVL